MTSPQQLADITLQHYNDHAADFGEGTRGHDVSQNIAALLDHLVGVGPYTILDFGCGPGRDLKTFRTLGHVAVGVEGAAEFVQMARDATGCEVWHQNFLDLALPIQFFDGVFANASLFHVPRPVLAEVLQKLHATLKPNGVLFCSNPRGQNQEEMSRGRYGAFYDLATWRIYLTDAGFSEITHFYRPAGLPRDQQPWLASVWRKPA